LLTKRACSAVKDDGESCRQTPLRDADFCFWHDPDHAREAAEARRLGGLRRRRERTVQGAYEFEGLRTIDDIRRLLEIGITDVLALDNSIARARTLAYLGQVALRVFEVGRVEERIEDLEKALGSRLKPIGRRR
jgi:hypothetical protein